MVTPAVCCVPVGRVTSRCCDSAYVAKITTMKVKIAIALYCEALVIGSLVNPCSSVKSHSRIVVWIRGMNMNIPLTVVVPNLEAFCSQRSLS